MHWLDIKAQLHVHVLQFFSFFFRFFFCFFSLFFTQCIQEGSGFFSSILSVAVCVGVSFKVILTSQSSIPITSVLVSNLLQLAIYLSQDPCFLRYTSRFTNHYFSARGGSDLLHKISQFALFYYNYFFFSFFKYFFSSHAI